MHRNLDRRVEVLVRLPGEAADRRGQPAARPRLRPEHRRRGTWPPTASGRAPVADPDGVPLVDLQETLIAAHHPLSPTRPARRWAQDGRQSADALAQQVANSTGPELTSDSTKPVRCLRLRGEDDGRALGAGAHAAAGRRRRTPRAPRPGPRTAGRGGAGSAVAWPVVAKCITTRACGPGLHRHHQPAQRVDARRRRPPAGRPALVVLVGLRIARSSQAKSPAHSRRRPGPRPRSARSPCDLRAAARRRPRRHLRRRRGVGRAVAGHAPGGRSASTTTFCCSGVSVGSMRGDQVGAAVPDAVADDGVVVAEPVEVGRDLVRGRRPSGTRSTITAPPRDWPYASHSALAGEKPTCRAAPRPRRRCSRPRSGRGRSPREEALDRAVGRSGLAGPRAVRAPRSSR